MSEELMTLVQVMELYGKGITGLGRAIRMSAKGVGAGLNLAKIKEMQLKMKLHYASEGKHTTMKLKDLEKLTGGNYKILNIPLENEDELIGFYDRLKKMKVSFAELPDLCLGDGYTQIAYNPQDADKIKTVVDHYRKHLSHIPKDITMSDYEKLGGEEGKRILNDLAEKGYTAEMTAEHIQRIHDRNRDDKYRPITLDIETLLLEEHKDKYYFRVPGTFNEDGTCKAICVPKKDALIINDGKTVFSHLRSDAKVDIFLVDSEGRIDLGKSEKTSLGEWEEHFDIVSSSDLKQVNRIRPTETDKMPNFHKGQGEDPSVQTKEKVAEIIRFEDIKKRSESKDYLPITIDERSMVSEDRTRYVTKLPTMKNDPNSDELSKLLIIEKSDTIRDDGVIRAYLKKGALSDVREVDRFGITKREYKMENERIAKYYLESEKLKVVKGKTHKRTYDGKPIRSRK